MEPDSWAPKETCFRHFPTSGPSPGAAEAHELPFSQVYETPFYVAVDHDKKKVVISIRGTLSPKVRRPVTPPAPRAPSQPLGGAPTSFSLLSAPRLTVLPAPQDALTDLTGDAERLPVDGHHGTWLGHKVASPLLGPQWPPGSSLLPAGRPGPRWGGGSSRVTPLTKRDGQSGVGQSGRSTAPHRPGTPQPCAAQTLSHKRELKEAMEKGSHWLLLDPQSL